MKDMETVENSQKEEQLEWEEQNSVVYDEENVKYHSSESKTEKKSGKGSFIRELIVYAVIIVLCVTVVPRYVIQRTQVDGDSMKNTLHNMESLLVEKVTYKFKDPDRFDIITFYPKGRDHEEYYIKRVIGLPGETVQIKGDTIYIDGEVLKEEYGREPMEYAGIAEDPIKLGADEFFVLGDNRNESVDSRDGEDVGLVKRKNIDGHAILRIYPFSEFGTIQNKNEK